MAESFDKFDLLPESLLLSIISLLPFKEVARTSILSKSWLHKWLKTSNIEFNELFFVKFNQPYDIRKAQRRDFLNFITLWLDNHKESVVKKFSLKLSTPENAHEIVERCIAFAIQYGVKELGLDFSDPNWEEEEFPTEHESQVELPSHVYEHKSLEYLKLFSCSFREIDLINFYALKEVSFGYMEVTQTAIKTLLSNCEMIESLSLKRCWNSSQFEIGSNELMLRRLVVDNCIFECALFKINAPNLVFLKYSGLMSLFEIQTSLVIEEADIDFGLEFETTEHGHLLCNLIKALYPVKVLTVCSYVLQVISSGHNLLRIERNMNVKHLIMKTDLDDDELPGISFLLNSCPLLECLTFELGFGRTLEDDGLSLPVDYQSFWIDNGISYECLKSTVKVVEMNNFIGSVNKLLVICYLIRHGSVLEKFSVNVLKGEVDEDNGNAPFYREIEELVMGTTRASSDLQISFNY